jgi:hypothetical protein
MRVLCIAVVTSALFACARVEAVKQPVEVEMHNVDLHVAADVTLHVPHLRGHFDATGQREIPFLDETTSYSVTVDSGIVSIDLASLNALLTRTLAEDRSNVEQLKIATDADGNLRQKGVIDKGIDVPFSVRAGIQATPDGKLRIVTKSVKGFGVPMKPLMKLFHIEMDDLLKVKPGHGVTVVGNDLILDPATLLPPPSIHGKVASAKVVGKDVVQVFGDGLRRRLSPPAVSRNYIYWRGGSLSFGKLTMTATDLELVDMDPADPFDFSVEHWNDQLVAGYSKTTAARGLKAHMPDYNDLGRLRQPVTPKR